mmetsp:Transcript_125332/g.350978  ORF Transcript_125332/g.350978 Transcript_125332/m.350978 type:complete len:650 (-) Transcript_125332:96-2045(-)
MPPPCEVALAHRREENLHVSLVAKRVVVLAPRREPPLVVRRPSRAPPGNPERLHLLVRGLLEQRLDAPVGLGRGALPLVRAIKQRPRQAEEKVRFRPGPDDWVHPNGLAQLVVAGVAQRHTPHVVGGVQPYLEHLPVLEEDRQLHVAVEHRRRRASARLRAENQAVVVGDELQPPTLFQVVHAGDVQAHEAQPPSLPQVALQKHPLVVLDVADLRGDGHALAVARPLRRETPQRLLCGVGHPEAQKQRGHHEAGPPLSGLAMHHDDVGGVRLEEFLHVPADDVDVREGARVVVWEADVAVLLLETALGVHPLDTQVVDLVATAVPDLEESLDLAHRVPQLGLEHAARGPTHRDDLGRDVRQVQIKAVVGVHIAVLLLGDDVFRERAHGEDDGAQAQPIHRQDAEFDGQSHKLHRQPLVLDEDVLLLPHAADQEQGAPDDIHNEQDEVGAPATCDERARRQVGQHPEQGGEGELVFPMPQQPTAREVVHLRGAATVGIDTFSQGAGAEDLVDERQAEEQGLRRDEEQQRGELHRQPLHPIERHLHPWLGLGVDGRPARGLALEAEVPLPLRAPRARGLHGARPALQRLGPAPTAAAVALLDLQAPLWRHPAGRRPRRAQGAGVCGRRGCRRCARLARRGCGNARSAGARA